MNKINQPWFRCFKPNPQARLRLFCFPHAGGGAAGYAAWPPALPDVELYAVQLPGRENRICETPFTQCEPVVQQVCAALQPYLDWPFALFGHSMGSLLAYEVAQTLCRTGVPPTQLLVSGRRAPHLPDPYPPLHHLPDAGLLAAIQQRYGGIPAVVFQESELRALFTPLLRADFTLVETYQPSTTLPLACPIVAFGGEHDRLTPKSELLAWGKLTARTFALHLLPGGHFYLNEQRALLLARLAAVLR